MLSLSPSSLDISAAEPAQRFFFPKGGMILWQVLVLDQDFCGFSDVTYVFHKHFLIVEGIEGLDLYFGY